jgi:hypothetical protein
MVTSIDKLVSLGGDMRHYSLEENRLRLNLEGHRRHKLYIPDNLVQTALEQRIDPIRRNTSNLKPVKP